MMDDFLKKYGPWAIITGGTSGTGYLFAQKLADKGMSLVLVARGEEALLQTQKKLIDQYQVQVKTIAVDLSNQNSVQQIRKEIEGLEIGLLINNAGYSITEEFHRENWENQSKLLETIFNTPIALTHLFVQDMVKRGKGGVIFVSSSVAYTSTPLWSIYSGGKAGILTFGESISQELKKYNVDVLTVCPGPMKTKFQDRSGISSPGLMDPDKVVSMTLRSLGRKISLLPGFSNKMMFQFLGRLLPKKVTLPLFETMMKKIQK